MTQEFVWWFLFLMLTFSMCGIFQFMLARLKSIETALKKTIKSVEKIHRESYRSRPAPIPPRRRQTVQTRPEVLTGTLQLQHRGETADCRAAFMLDKE